MFDYEIDEMSVALACVTCGDSLEAWEMSETSTCFICETISEQRYENGNLLRGMRLGIR